MSTALSIKVMRSSTWRSKGPYWSISLVDQNTFRFASDETDESFEQPLAFIEEHAQIIPRPLVSYVYLRLKDSAKKKITFRIEKSSIPLWNEMKGPPTLQGLALTLKQVTKPDIPWGLILVGFSLLPHPEVEQPGLIQDIESALLGISILGIAIVARKIPHVTFFLFQMTWELVFFISIAINLISAGDDMSMQVIQAAFFLFFLVIFRHRMIQHYKNYKRYSSLTN